MSSFKNNRIVLAVFAILMAIGLMAAYIPMLFPPSAVPDATIPNEADADNYAANLPNNPAPVATTTVTSTVPGSPGALRLSAGPGRTYCDACADRDNYGGRAYRRWCAS